jgi:hypothetical protein
MQPSRAVKVSSASHQLLGRGTTKATKSHGVAARQRSAVSCRRLSATSLAAVVSGSDFAFRLAGSETFSRPKLRLEKLSCSVSRQLRSYGVSSVGVPAQPKLTSL